MRRAVLCALTLLVPLAAPAVAQVAPGNGERSVTPGATGLDVTASAASRALGDPSTALQLPAPQPAASGPRRRGSMVGYIEDTVVSSKVRVRFDSGFTITDPDRAEFFYAKCGCYRGLPTSSPAYDPDAPGPGPGIATDLNFQQLYVQGEFAATERVSVFGELPMRWLQPQTFAAGTGSFANQSGVSDLRAGVKLALADTLEQMVTAQVKTFLPTGDAGNGLGTDHASIEPAILYYRQVSDRAAFESQVALWIPFGGSNGVPTSIDDKFAGNVLSYGIGQSFDLYRSGTVRFAPVVELVGWRVLGGFQTSDFSDASGTNIVNLKFGGRLTVRDQDSLYVGYGHALTDAEWYENILRFEYRHAF